MRRLVIVSVKEIEWDTDSIPRYVLGRNVHASTPKQLYDGTNAVFLNLLTGDSDPTTPPEIGVSVHVDDASWLHVLALDQNKVAKSKPVQNFFVSRGKPLTLWLLREDRVADQHRHHLGQRAQDCRREVPRGRRVRKILGHWDQEVEAWCLQCTQVRGSAWTKVEVARRYGRRPHQPVSRAVG